MALKRVLRVGMVPSEPWLYTKPSPREDDSAEEIYSGYTFDLLSKLKSKLNFDFEIVTSVATTSGSHRL